MADFSHLSLESQTSLPDLTPSHSRPALSASSSSHHHHHHGHSCMKPDLLREMMMVPAAQNNIDTQFVVLDKGRSVMRGQSKTCLALVADETASVHFQFWGGECDAFEPGDILRLANGIFSYHKSNLVLGAGKRGTVEKAGEFTMVFVEKPNMSEMRWVSDPNQSNNFISQEKKRITDRL